MKVCVVGAGIVGLNTALELQKQFNNLEITVIADKFNTETTSDGAAGLFLTNLKFQGPNESLRRKWLQDSFYFYKNHLNENCGVFPLTGYHFSTIEGYDMGIKMMESISSEYRVATKAELNHLSVPFVYGEYVSTMVIACRKFLPWCLDRLQRSGVRVKQQTLNDFTSLYQDYDVVFNCSGLNARYLCKDEKIFPLRGQVLQVHAPWVKQFYIFNSGYNYIIPTGINGIVTLGGTAISGSYDMKVSPITADSILNECSKLMPSLRNAPKVRDWVGLRPFRDEVRVELEKQGRSILIHNYGHGGSGVTAAPGTSKYAVKLLKDFQRSGTVSRL